jgi:hypothetical protein
MTFELISIFSALNALGAIIGTAFVTWGEIFYTRAAADERIDHHERKYLRHLFRSMKFGMLLVLISSVALVVLEYLVPTAPETVLTSPFWALQTFVWLILILGWLLSKDRVAWWFGSAAILVAWWMIVLIDFGFLDSYTYLVLIAAYVVVTFVLAGLLGYVRIWTRRHLSSHHHS